MRDFLELRRDGAVRQADNVESRRADGNRGRQEGGARFTGNVPDSIRTWNLRSRDNNSQNEGDRAWARRFGKGDNDRGERSLRPDSNGPRDANWSRRLAEGNRQVDGRGESTRRFGDRDFVDRKYQDWRKNAWHGERGGRHDHRDRSGRWKDGDRFVAAHRIRDHWKGHKDFHNVPFRGGWWKDHRRHGRHWHHWDHFAHHHHRPFYWWSGVAAPRLTTWISFGWQTPYYWDYGFGEYIYCYNNVIYVNGAWFQPAPIYHEQTLVLAQHAPDWTADEAAQAEWMPLGVFAISRDGVADANVLVQLAVTKDGVIGGTVFNQLTGTTFAVEGMVDKQTQRAVWTYVDETSTTIVMETSIFNLTQPEATGLIHYGPDNIQVIELVRLEEPGLEAPAVAP